MSEPLLLYCTALPPAQVCQSKAFTTLPVRQNNRNDIADAGSLAFITDWALVMQDGREKTHHGAISKTGNLTSFLWPECMPERLGLLSYFNEIGHMHDGMSFSTTW